MQRPTFRVKRYSHRKYKFLVRWKAQGKWKRRYFVNAEQAHAFADAQNASGQTKLNGDSAKEVEDAPRQNGFKPGEGAGDRVENLANAGIRNVHSLADKIGGAGDAQSARRPSRLAKVVEPIYLGPRIERYLGDSWCMHLPFAYDLMRELAPNVFVELGVKCGESYFAFCQSAAENKINVKCYGVDSWRGDVQTGNLDPKIEEEVAEYNWRYSSFSELKSMMFAEALGDFPNSTIDLLHIDGTHTYCDVKSDFESWLPKLSPNGIILFHDVMVRDRGFGVWKLWEEIARPGNSFVFEFGYGLGLWKKQTVSTEDSQFIRRLLLASEAEERDINDYYATAAAALALWQNVQKQSQAGALDLPPSISPRIEIFANQGGGYSQKVSISEPLVRDTWQTIRLRNLDQIYTDKGRRLRIDPIDCPSLVLLSSIRIVRERDDAVLYGAERPADFEKLQFSDNVQTKVEGENFLLLVADSDPQIYLPILATLPDEALRAEITLKVETASRDLMIRHAKTWQVRSDLEMVAKSMQVRLAEQENQMRLVETERDELKKLAERADAEFKKRDRQQRKDLESNDEQRNQIRNFEARNQDLSNTLTDLEQNITRFKEFFGLTSEGIERGESPITILIDSLSNLIRRIRRKTPLWKGSKLAGKTLRITSIQSLSPKTVAKQLKQELQRLKNTLKSKKTSPAAALKALTELIVLRTFAKDLVSALSAKSLFLSHQADRSSPAVASAMQALFDPSWYARKYGYTPTTGMSPLQHYLMVGGRLGYDPHPLFDTRWYLSQRRKTEELAISPLEDYIVHGAEKGYSPHPQFDSNFYTKNYPDSLGNGLTPLGQYLTVGWKNGCRPNPDFDPKFYLQTYPDVATAKVEPFTHYVLGGQSEGRVPCQEKVFRFSTPDFEIPRTPLSTDSIIVPRVKAIAFYLPQFHPIPENDRWWGEGFTEWDNVRSGNPNYSNHYQPHVPADLGYYDLRDPEVLRKQTELARTYGISGFCFYYYWFGGKVLLDLPIRTMLETGRPDYPFCICWANENWTRRWDGREEDVLIAQRHSNEDDNNFIEHIEQVLLQKNYIRVNGKPLLLVYRPSLLPSAVETTARWRSYFQRRGHGDLHLTMVRSFYDQTEPQGYGFDAAVQFPPHFPAVSVKPWIAQKNEGFAGDVYDYLKLRKLTLEQLQSFTQRNRTYPGVTPCWDNTARRGRDAIIWANSSPEAYYEWLSAAADEVQKTQTGDERLLFINAWNEWGEGCHLEPDEKYGHAWLNATALALNVSAASISKASAETHPEPPAFEEIEIPAISQPAKLAISVLFYHREDLIAPFLESILPQIAAAESQSNIRCELNLAFNYQPSVAATSDIKSIVGQKLPARPDAVHVFEHGFNLGFGAGHNSTFHKSDCDVFLILNSDVRVKDENWLISLIDQFHNSDQAIIGLTQTASCLREDGCGIPVTGPDQEFDFVDGSVMALRAELARRFGLFSPAFDYFYFEDADLCLRYRQIGLKIGLLDIPYEHERSSSSRLLPQFAIEGVLNRNRARFFNRWENYLRTRTLSNRIGITFLDTDRQLQCASLPAIFSLLSEHKTAVIDIQGVHTQLISLFEHQRIRLIPSWQQLRQNDYLRFYELDLNRSQTPQVYDIAHRMGCDPDFHAAKEHLRLLAGSATSDGSKKALLYLDRKSPVFDGKQPHVEGFATAVEMLQANGFAVRLFTNYGTFEVQNHAGFDQTSCHHVAPLPAINLVNEIASADLLVTSDNWISELAQLLGKRAFVWLGAVGASAAIWDVEHATCFTDKSLDCLGCYHRFGQKQRNICLRGDTACMRACLAKDLSASLESFIDGHAAEGAQIHLGRSATPVQTILQSRQLSLEDWPSSTANAVLVLTPLNPTLDKLILNRAKELAHRASKGIRGSRIVYDSSGKAPPRGATFPHRLAAITPLRQAMIDRHLKDEQWVFWVDADLVDYPADLIEKLIERAEGGIAAPLVLMEGDVTEPAYPAGFGPGRFYDIAGFVEKGRWARFTPPYFDQIGPVYELDSVGCCYLVNADLYRWGARHDLDEASKAFIAEARDWPGDAIKQNQAGPANSFSDHYTVCKFARRAGVPVRAFADLIAYHQRG